MSTLPLLQRRTLQAISEKSKKTLPGIALRALLDRGLITAPTENGKGCEITEEGKKELEDNEI